MAILSGGTDLYDIFQTPLYNYTTAGNLDVPGDLTGSGNTTAFGVFKAYSGIVFTQSDSTARIIKKVNIGDWNMDSTANKSVSHGLSSTEWKTIRNPQITIRNDADSAYYNLIKNETGLSKNSGINSIDSTNITLFRNTLSDFNSANFDSTSYNRGWITFWYTPD